MSPKLTEFDRDTLEVATKLAREHDPSLTEDDAQPVFLSDFPKLYEEATGRSLSMPRLALLRLSMKLPQDRGRVGGEPFWIRRDVATWASSRGEQSRTRRG
jgi:hypothetical protein